MSPLISALWLMQKQCWKTNPNIHLLIYDALCIGEIGLPGKRQHGDLAVFQCRLAVEVIQDGHLELVWPGRLHVLTAHVHGLVGHTVTLMEHLNEVTAYDEMSTCNVSVLYIKLAFLKTWFMSQRLVTHVIGGIKIKYNLKNIFFFNCILKDFIRGISSPKLYLKENKSRPLWIHTGCDKVTDNLH